MAAAIAVPVISVASRTILSALGGFLAKKGLTAALPYVGRAIASGAGKIPDAFIPAMVRSAGNYLFNNKSSINNTLLNAAANAGGAAAIFGGMGLLSKLTSSDNMDHMRQIVGTRDGEMGYVQVLDYLNRRGGGGQFSPYNLMYNEVSRDERLAISRVKTASDLYALRDKAIAKETEQKAIEYRNETSGVNRYGGRPVEVDDEDDGITSRILAAAPSFILGGIGAVGAAAGAAGVGLAGINLLRSRNTL